MLSMSVKITGKQGISNIALPKALSIWEAEMAPALLAEIRRRAPISPTENGGRLRDSITVTRRSTASGIEARFTSSAPYAKYVESGTAPHRIEPRQALALHWQDRGRNVFAARVNHPGTKANPFVRNAIQAMMPLMKQRLRTQAEQEFKP